MARMIQPPTIAPAIPIKMSTNAPYPEPRMIFPVIQPAMRPTMIHHRKCINYDLSAQYEPLFAFLDSPSNAISLDVYALLQQNCPRSALLFSAVPRLLQILRPLA